MAELTLNIAVPASNSSVFKTRKSAPKSSKKRIELRRKQKNLKWKQKKQGKQPFTKKVNKSENDGSNMSKISLRATKDQKSTAKTNNDPNKKGPSS